MTCTFHVFSDRTSLLNGRIVTTPEDRAYVAANDARNTGRPCPATSAPKFVRSPRSRGVVMKSPADQVRGFGAVKPGNGVVTAYQPNELLESSTPWTTSSQARM